MNKEAIFDFVKNVNNWKLPTQPATAHNHEDAKMVADAIIYYAGGAEISEKQGEFTITSRGYYHYIGT